MTPKRDRARPAASARGRAAYLAFHLGLDGGGQLLASGDAQGGLEAGAVLGLGEQVGGDEDGVGALVGQHRDLGGAGDHLDADDPVDLALGGHRVRASGSDDLVDGGHGAGAVGQRRHRLGAADAVDLVEAEEAGGGQQAGVGQAGGAGRGDDADLVDAGHLGGNGGHEQAGDERRLAARHADADAAQGGDAAAEDDAVGVLAEPGVDLLGLVEGADVGGGAADGGHEVRVGGVQGVPQGLPGDAEAARRQTHAVEAGRELGHRLVAAVAHRRQDAGHGLLDLGGDGAASAEDLGQPAPQRTPGGVVDEVEHAPGLQ